MLSCLGRAEDSLKSLGAAAGAMERSRRKAGLLRARLELGQVSDAMVEAPVATLTRLLGRLERVGCADLGRDPPAAGHRHRPFPVRPPRRSGPLAPGGRPVRLEIGYRMHFRYSEAVTESQNEVRVRPRDDDCQRVVSYRLTSQPPVPVLQTRRLLGDGGGAPRRPHAPQRAGTGC